jgi:hypothetical protein
MRAIISYDMIAAWECAYISVNDEDAPDELTPEWLLANPTLWEWEDIKDRGDSGINGDTLTVEETF